MDITPEEMTVAAMAELWPRDILSPMAQRAFFSALANYSFEQISKALIDFWGDPDEEVKSQFRPAPGQLKKYLPRTMEDITPDDQAAIVWSKIIADISNHGSGQEKATICNHALQWVSRMGGWGRLSELGADIYGIEKEFKGVYKAMIKIERVVDDRPLLQARRNTGLQQL